MKILIGYCIIILFSMNPLFSQSVSEYNRVIDSLNIILKEVNLEIEKLNMRKTDLVNLLRNNTLNKENLEFKNQLSVGVPYKVIVSGIIRDEPNYNGKEVIKIASGENVLVYDYYKRPFFRVNYNGVIGYLSHVLLELDENLEEIVKKGEPELTELTLEEKIIANKIKRKEIWIGMTSQMTLSSIGMPDDIRKTTFSWGVHEQWIYSKKNLFLYFENGVLKAIQE